MEDPLEGEPKPAGRTRQQALQTQKNKKVVESSSPVVRRKQTDQRRILPGPFEQQKEKDSGSKPSAPEQPKKVAPLKPVEKDGGQKAKVTGTLKDHVVEELQDLLDWVKRQNEPDYKQMKADLEVIQEKSKKMQKERLVMVKALDDLKA